MQLVDDVLKNDLGDLISPEGFMIVAAHSRVPASRGKTTKSESVTISPRHHQHRKLPCSVEGLQDE